MTNTTFALAFALLTPRVGPDEALSALKFANAVCNVLDPLSNDEIKRTATIIAEYWRVHKVVDEGGRP
jgi:hypothetical protein